MKHLDLFSGIGGFALAARWTWGEEYETAAFCEIDKFCQKVLRKNFGDVSIYEDIKKLDGTQFTNIDLLTGGFPCQPFSVAGKRKGNEDDRALWPEMLRVIQEVKPRWIVGENVAGFVNMALDQSIADLENEGYEVQTFIIPACAVNAPHRRDRVWIVAYYANARTESMRESKISAVYATNTRCEYGEGQTVGCEHEEADGQRETVKSERSTPRDGNRIISNPQSGSDRFDQTEHEGREDNTGRFEQVDTDGESESSSTKRPEQFDGQKQGEYRRSFSKQSFAGGHGAWSENWHEVATRFCRVDDGVYNRVDRLKSLGNAIVPQVAFEIMKAIKEIDQK